MASQIRRDLAAARSQLKPVVEGLRNLESVLSTVLTTLDQQEQRLDRLEAEQSGAPNPPASMKGAAPPTATGAASQLALVPVEKNAEEEGQATLSEVEVGKSARFEVVHGPRVAARKSPSTSAPFVGSLQKGQRVTGTPTNVDGTLWLSRAVKGSQEWVLMDGTALGLGPLLRPWVGPEPVTMEEKARLVSELTPSVEDQDAYDPEAPTWIVVGGADKRGIIVRREAALSSSAYEVRLATGSRIEELEVSGNRLHYRRLRGDGPNVGWVNLKGKDGHSVVELESE